MKKRFALVLLGTFVTAVGLSSCLSAEDDSSSSGGTSISAPASFDWKFEKETYVPDLDPAGNFIDYLGLPAGPTSLTLYQGYDDVNGGDPYVRYEDLGSPESPYAAVEMRVDETVDYLAYYLPREIFEDLEARMPSYYEENPTGLFGAADDGLLDGRFIHFNSLEGNDSLLRMMAYERLEDVCPGDGDYSIVALFERKSVSYEFDLATSKELSERHWLIARLILDGEGRPLSSLYDLYGRTDESRDRERAYAAYRAERSTFESASGLCLDFRRFGSEDGGYVQAPGWSTYRPFYKERGFKAIHELRGATLISECRYQDGVDLLEEGLPDGHFPMASDPFGESLRPLFKEAWVFDAPSNASLAYFDWAKLRLSLGEARRAHLAALEDNASS